MDLVRLESYGTGFAATVSGRFGEGTPADHDLLDGALEVRSGFVSGLTRHIFHREDLAEWARVLDLLESGESASWLAESGRTAEVHFDTAELSDGILLITVDEPLSSRVKVELVVDVDEGWIEELRIGLAEVLAAYPEETVQTSPGVFTWRNR